MLDSAELGGGLGIGDWGLAIISSIGLDIIVGVVGVVSCC
jgi:hypothetical protein